MQSNLFGDNDLLNVPIQEEGDWNCIKDITRERGGCLR